MAPPPPASAAGTGSPRTHKETAGWPSRSAVETAALGQMHPHSARGSRAFTDRSRGPGGACACVWGVEHVNPASVRCAVCCMLRVACVLSGWVYKPASDPAGAPWPLPPAPPLPTGALPPSPGSGICRRFLDSLDPVVQRLELAEAPSALRH